MNGQTTFKTELKQASNLKNKQKRKKNKEIKGTKENSKKILKVTNTFKTD